MWDAFDSASGGGARNELGCKYFQVGIGDWGPGTRESIPDPWPPTRLLDQCVMVSSVMAGWTAVSAAAAVAAMAPSGRASAIFNTSSIVSTM